MIEIFIPAWLAANLWLIILIFGVAVLCWFDFRYGTGGLMGVALIFLAISMASIFGLRMLFDPTSGFQMFNVTVGGAP